MKKRGEGFLEYIRRARHPVIYEAKRKADERAVKIKGMVLGEFPDIKNGILGRSNIREIGGTVIVKSPDFTDGIGSGYAT